MAPPGNKKLHLPAEQRKALASNILQEMPGGGKGEAQEVYI